MPRNQMTFTIYQAKDGYRWRAKRGGRVVADSGEAYTRRFSAHAAAQKFVAAIEYGEAVIIRPEVEFVRDCISE